MPYHRPKRSYVLPVVATLAVIAPLSAIALQSSPDYRNAGNSDFSAIPARFAEVVLSSAPDAVLPLHELSGLNLPDLHLSDLRRLPLPSSVPIPPNLPLPPGLQLPAEIPLPQLGDPQTTSTAPQARSAAPTPQPGVQAPLSPQVPDTQPTSTTAPLPYTPQVPSGPQAQAPATPAQPAPPPPAEPATPQAPAAFRVPTPPRAESPSTGDESAAITRFTRPSAGAARVVPGPAPVRVPTASRSAATQYISSDSRKNFASSAPAGAVRSGAGHVVVPVDYPTSPAAPEPSPTSAAPRASANPDAATSDPALVPGADPAAPALAPGAVSPEVAAQVGAQVKEVTRDTPFSMVALTAKDLDGTTAMIRARGADGAWGAWYSADPIETGPTDATTADRAGTEPIYVGRTKDVQVLLTHKADAADHTEGATDLSAVLIDPGHGPSDAALSAIAAPLANGGPKVITRAQWGADPSLLCDKPTVDDGLSGIAVHHTAGRNDYTAAESPGIVRAIYTYHAKTLGWCDIGYNALVDKYGQIFEGRAGGLDKPVQGAHAGGFNEHTAGVALMGDFQSQPPTDAAIQAAGRFIGWRAGMAGLNPLSNTTLYSQGTGYTKYKKGAAVKLPTIFAHRDVGKTTCPGNAAYARMDRIRRIAAQTASSAGSAKPANNAVSQDNSEQSANSGAAPSNSDPNAAVSTPDSEPSTSPEPTRDTTSPMPTLAPASPHSDAQR
ncbi:peptidoglycan recognition protein family protein [Nocardia vaccinii]|uniref:peptidoglycan recognition protein family protein n=1 Tax=Nocardia vaccinii TaxID=1822 RepID=UPI000B21643D|nr:N-acetylmuramoyl-L-alanine amidase [Nocardia vaccinii]